MNRDGLESFACEHFLTDCVDTLRILPLTDILRRLEEGKVQEGNMRDGVQDSLRKNWLLAVLIAALLLLPGCTPREIQAVESTAGTITESPTAEVSTPEPTVTPEPTPTPTPTAIPTLPPIPEPTPCGLLSWRESWRFTEEGVEQGETYYKSPNVSITIETVHESTSSYTNRSLTYYVADIYIKDITSLRRGFAKGTFAAGGFRGIDKMVEQYSQILVMSGDQTARKMDCLVIHDGELVYDSGTYTRDLCVLYKDGTMEVYSPEDIDKEAILAKDPWQSWSFGPILLDEKGRAAETFNLPDSISSRNPRAVLGYYEPGHYCFIVVDGRRSGHSLGLSMQELAQFAEDMEFTAAYNLDGGVTSQIAFGGQRLNKPVGDRALRDVLYIVDDSAAQSEDAQEETGD